MTKKQEPIISGLLNIEAGTTRKEKNPDHNFLIAMAIFFKSIHSMLFDNRQNISQKEIYQSVEQQDKQLTFSNGNPYPNNFGVVEAIANGSCFFDSFRQSLEQQKGIKVTVEQLRRDCQEFAQKNPPEWFTSSIANSYDNYGNVRRETITSYGTDILVHSRWGDPEVEGRILCEKYGVKLHVVESNPWYAVNREQEPELEQDQFLHQLIDNSGSKSVGEQNRVDYNSDSVLHIINKGGLHFEPLLDRNKSLTRRPKEQTQEQKDFLLARQLQEKEDYLLAVQLQRQEYNSLKRDNEKNTFQEKDSGYAGELLTKILQKGGGDEIDRLVKGIVKALQKNNPKENSPNCSMQQVRSSPHQQHVQQAIKGC